MYCHFFTCASAIGNLRSICLGVYLLIPFPDLGVNKESFKLLFDDIHLI